MISKKLEKIARQYRIDPATLPPIDGKSVTVNISQPVDAAPAPPPAPVTLEARQSEYSRLRNEYLAAKKRFEEYVRADKERRMAARRQGA